jgi:hypothetical protein
LGLAETFSAVKTFTAAPVVTLNDETDGVLPGLTLTHSSSNNAATAADGVSISFQLENAAGTSTVEEWASLVVASTTITNGSEDGDVVLSAMLGGTVSEVLRVDASDQYINVGVNATDADGVHGLRIYPVTTAKGSLILNSVAHASADYATTVQNATDGGAAAIITLPSGTSKLAGMTTNTATTTDAATDAFPLTHGVIAKTLHASAKTLTLADGFPGQELFIYVSVDGGGKGTLTPTTKTGYTSVELDKAGDAVLLRFLPTVGWIILGAYGITTAPVILA